MMPLWRRGRRNPHPDFVANSPAESRPFSSGEVVGPGAFSVIWIGVSFMQTDHPKHHKRPHREPSFWVDTPVDDALSLLENALREDHPAHGNDGHRDEVFSLREENARLRKLLAELPPPVR